MNYLIFIACSLRIDIHLKAHQERRDASIMPGSEVAQVQEQIVAEYMAAKLGLEGLASGTSQHRIMTAKTERLGAFFETLTHLVGSPQKAIQIVAETLDSLPEQATHHQVVAILRHELGTKEETEILIERVVDMWETMDLLVERFGSERARKIIDTPSSISS
jgi:hypothetical protein